MNSQTISLARHTASGIKIDVGSLWWQKVKILAPVRESARVHQDHPCLYSSRAKIGVSDPGKIPPTCSSTQSVSQRGLNFKSVHTHTHHTFNPSTANMKT
ncbi:hypothetical protein PoB_007659000 [Plakobranchus ocellatus]|uniref:Uncharacterized protein n=1 Tax=Plakobranchus ocellatus TaxID=259542 RepID=A0AAV4E182_9GAST|nr:hypothetical protein PoB_007659000 [Plakobranchus ocellatus]